MIQIRTPIAEARQFIGNMTSQGYEAHEVTRHGVIDVHFTINGVTTADYSVMIADDYAYIGVRPQ
jgi:hypothetical protein